jgi:ATP-dependent protease ClpP protease subunit
MSSRSAHSFLADLGELVAADGIVASHGDLILVAGAAQAVSPAAAAVLIDPGQPHVARRRALAVVSAAVLRNAAARRSLRQALVDDVVPRDSYPAAA